MSIYIPTHEELIEMGFIPTEWEGNIYRYDYKALSWHTNVDINGSPRKEEWMKDIRDWVGYNQK